MVFKLTHEMNAACGLLKAIFFLNEKISIRNDWKKVCVSCVGHRFFTMNAYVVFFVFASFINVSHITCPVWIHSSRNWNIISDSEQYLMALG